MLEELVRRNRSYRGYDCTHTVTKEELTNLVALARITPSAANLQPLKYRIVCEPEEVAQVQKCTRWAAALPHLHLPYAGKEPTAFIVVCIDMGIAKNPAVCLRDVGIVSQTMLLGATERGLGGCMIANFDHEALRDVLALPTTICPDLVIAIGKPDEVVVLTKPKDGSVKYYRDDNDAHYVPKRPLEELLL